MRVDMSGYGGWYERVYECVLGVCWVVCECVCASERVSVCVAVWGCAYVCMHEFASVLVCAGV